MAPSLRHPGLFGYWFRLVCSAITRLTAFFLISLAILSKGTAVAEENVVAAINFDKESDSAFISTAGEIKNTIEPYGEGKALHANSMESGNGGNVLKIGLPGSGVYRVSFDYEILGGKNGSILTQFGSPGVRSIFAGASHTEFCGVPGVYQHATTTAVLLPGFDHYQFEMNLRNKADVIIANIKVMVVEDPQFTLNNTTANAGLAGPPVTGATNFVVVAPHPKTELVVSANDYGVSAGSEDNTEAFRRAIAYCKKVGASELTVKPGTYHFFGHGDILGFYKFNDFTFDGQGSEFIFSTGDINEHAQFIAINDCARIIFRNFTIDWDYDKIPLTSHGRITAISADRKDVDMTFVDYPDFKWRDMPISHGYKLDKNLNPAYGLCLMPDFIGSAKKEWINGNTVRLKFPSELPRGAMGSLAVGQDCVLCYCAWGGSAVRMGSIANASFEKINVYASQGFGFWTSELDSIRFFECKIIRRPGSKRLMSTNADGLDVNNQRIGNLMVENCEFGYCGDDFINVHSGALCGIRLGGAPNKLVVKTEWAKYVLPAGSRIIVRNHDYSPTGFEAVIVSRKAGDGEVALTLDKPVPPNLPEDAHVIEDRHHTQNFIIRNNFFHNGYCRAILANAMNGLIENNRFLGISDSDILVYTDQIHSHDAEGSGNGNLIVRNNTFEDSSVQGGEETGASIRVSMYNPGKTWYPFQDGFSITGNKFLNPNGPAVFMTAVHDLTFADNLVQMDGPGPSKYIGGGNILVGSCSEDIQISDNKWVSSKEQSSSGTFIYPENTGNVSLFGNTHTSLP